MKIRLIVFLAFALAGLGLGADPSVQWTERSKSTAIVKFNFESEGTQHFIVAHGTVVDNQGVIVLPADTLKADVPAKQLSDFKIYLMGDATAYAADYLGRDPLNGWYYVRIEERARVKLKPVTDFFAKAQNTPTETVSAAPPSTNVEPVVMAPAESKVPQSETPKAPEPLVAASQEAKDVGAAQFPALWRERIKTVVAVEFYVVTETERRLTVSYGTVVDDHGTIILPSAAVNARVAPKQMTDFKVYMPGDGEGFDGMYLGQDALTGWHYVRVEEAALSRIVPITKFIPKDKVEPEMTEAVWGIGLRNKDEDFQPYYLTSNVALLQNLPQRTAIALHEVAGPGLPVFNQQGDFIGLAVAAFGQSYIQFSRFSRSGDPIMLVNVEESSAFQLTTEVAPYFKRIPRNVYGRPIAWLGTYGVEAIDPEVAKYLKLSAQSAAVVSEVLEGSPAQKAGMLDRDIIVAVDGQPLPRLKPDSVVPTYLEHEVEKHHPGDKVDFTVLRDKSQVVLHVVLGDEPRLMREAERSYFEKLGLTVREFVYGDAIARRIKIGDSSGVVAHFVKPNSPVALAGLQIDDWIKEIDGQEVKTYADAVAKLKAIEESKDRAEFVMLTSRGSETAVLRVKLK